MTIHLSILKSCIFKAFSFCHYSLCNTELPMLQRKSLHAQTPVYVTTLTFLITKRRYKGRVKLAKKVIFHKHVISCGYT